jgi:hypothetical protein
MDEMRLVVPDCLRVPVLAIVCREWCGGSWPDTVIMGPKVGIPISVQPRSMIGTQISEGRDDGEGMPLSKLGEEDKIGSRGIAAKSTA